MVKLEIDPISGKVLSYTTVQLNTPVFSTDIIVDGDELKGNSLHSVYYRNGEIIEDDCETEIEILLKKRSEISTKTDQEYFLELVMSGANASEASTKVKERKEEWDVLTKQIEELKSIHQKHVDEYYEKINQELDEQLEYKYYSAAVLLIKDENRYLKEWLDWNLGVGFDHVYIYDNGMVERVNEIISGCSEDIQSKVTVVDWTGHHDHIQQDAYNHFMDNYKHEVRWMMPIDSDEFVRFTDGISNNIDDFLKAYEKYTEVWGYELEYDANGQEKYEDKPVRERFTRQTDAREGFYWKNFIQVNRIDSFLMHYAYYDTAKHKVFKNEQKNQDLFVVDHYYTKSWEEWNWKIKKRGGADPKYHKALKEFFFYNPDMKYLDTGENAVQAYE